MDEITAPPLGDEVVKSQKTDAVSDYAIALSRVYEYDRSDSGGDIKLEIDLARKSLTNSFVAKKWRVAASKPRQFRVSPKHELALPAGVTVVIGGSGSGKTRLTLDRLTAGNQNVRYVRYAEPVDLAFRAKMAKNEDSMILADFEVDLAEEIVKAMVDPTIDAIVVDSFRYLFYSPAKSTGKGGVNMGLFTMLTHLDIMAAFCDKAIVVVVNPLTNNPDDFKFYVEAASGAVAAVITCESPTTIKYVSRETNERNMMSIALPERTFGDSMDTSRDVRETARSGNPKVDMTFMTK